MTSISDTNVVNAPGGLVEVARVSRTSNYSISATSVASAANIFSSNAVFIGDGSDYEVEFYAPEVYTATNAGSYVYVYLTDSSGTSLGAFGAVAYGDGTRVGYGQMYGKYILPTIAGTVYSLNARGTYSVAAGNMLGGSGPSDGRMPIYMVVRKIIQASQLVVPMVSAPLVTSLPSNAIDGQEVRYLADNTNGIIWNFRYRAGSSSAYKWEFIGGSPLYSSVGSAGGTRAQGVGLLDSNNITPITIPLAGDYDVTGYVGYAASNSGTTYLEMMLRKNSETGLDYNRTATFLATSTNQASSLAFEQRFTGNIAGDTFSMLYNSHAASAVFARMRMHVIPVRVSA